MRPATFKAACSRLGRRAEALQGWQRPWVVGGEPSNARQDVAMFAVSQGEAHPGVLTREGLDERQSLGSVMPSAAHCGSSGAQ